MKREFASARFLFPPTSERRLKGASRHLCRAVHAACLESARLATPSTPTSALCTRPRETAKLPACFRARIPADGIISPAITWCNRDSTERDREKGRGENKKQKKRAPLARVYECRISEGPFRLFRLTNDAVVESWLVRGYWDARGKSLLLSLFHSLISSESRRSDVVKCGILSLVNLFPRQIDDCVDYGRSVQHTVLCYGNIITGLSLRYHLDTIEHTFIESRALDLPYKNSDASISFVPFVGANFECCRTKTQLNASKDHYL